MVTFVIAIAIQKTIGFRVTDEDEIAGIDNAEHAETAYDLASLGGGEHHWSARHAEARNTEGSRA